MTATAYDRSLETDKYEQSVLILIDFMGFSNLVLENHSAEDEQRVVEFASYFEKRVHAGLKSVAGKGGAVSYRPSFTFFSDTVIIALPLDLHEVDNKYAFNLDTNEYEEREPLPAGMNYEKLMLLAGVHRLVVDIQLEALRNNLLSRGCVAVGDVYHKGHTWFGPAIVDAHLHEQKKAVYPRVILAKTGIDYFCKEVEQDQSGSWRHDADGFYFANYLDWIHTKLSDNNQYPEAHHRLRNILVSNMEKLEKEGNERALRKWEWLANYFNKETDDLVERHGDALADRITIRNS